MERRSDVVADDGVVVLGRLAGLLAEGGERALPDALDSLVLALGLRSAVLREAVAGTGRPGDLVAVAGEVVHAVPSHRGVRRLDPAAGPAVELPVHHTGADVAVLVVEGARPSQLAVLRAAAAVLGLALSPRRDGVPAAAPGGTAAALAALVDDAEHDRDALADRLHDGAVQSLVVARYAADAAVRAGDPTGSLGRTRDAVQAALVDVRRTLWQLRPRAGHDLVGALEDLSRRSVEAGAPALVVEVDAQAAAALPAAVAITAYRLVQALLDGTTPVVVRSAGPAIDVSGGRPLDDVDRWQRRAAAVGAGLDVSPGRLRLVPPAPLPEPPVLADPRPTTRPKATP